ncbi:calmodulin [Cyclospora cayetanensis]|uniref:Calmodulin n=2 Tax=Cyclospora cayetanensis TaxID=88456 RepID=A0A6P5WDI8_9EIME|nr:calmodulin [Cyclospora cayetanensis]OEH77840.1 EF hand domain-containing protein [Cyclospora cayetanensis]
MDSQQQFERLVTFVFRYFDIHEKGRVPAGVLGSMLRSLGQVWSFAEIVQVVDKQGEREITLFDFQSLARKKRAAELQSLNKSKQKKKNSLNALSALGDSVADPFPGLSLAEIEELRVCFSLLDPDGTQVCARNEIEQILTCLGEQLSPADVQQLFLLERLEGKQFLNFDEFARLCERI